jgi:hypothetical protein
MLQVLYELRQCEPSAPIIALLEVKHLDLEALTEQKRLIKGVYSDTTSTTNASSAAQSPKPAMVDEDDGASQYSGYSQSERLDESIVSKNSVCILVGAYLRKHAVTPKNINLHEFDFLLYTYKALFRI